MSPMFAELTDVCDSKYESKKIELQKPDEGFRKVQFVAEQRSKRLEWIKLMLQISPGTFLLWSPPVWRPGRFGGLGLARQGWQ